MAPSAISCSLSLPAPGSSSSLLWKCSYFALGLSYILEINDTAPGLMFDHEDEDLNHIKEVVLAKMNALWGSA